MDKKGIGEKLNQSFFARNSITVAKELLGKFLVTKIDGMEVVGKIVETEAYHGVDDLACHASKGRTPRTEVLFGEVGRLYVYLNYGIFYLVNVVCGHINFPSAVLIRAVEITSGIEFAQERIEESKFVKANDKLATGPGKLSIAFGLTKEFNNADLINSKIIHFMKNAETVKSCDIIQSKRVGVDYAKHCKDYLWRFYIKNNQFVSKQ